MGAWLSRWSLVVGAVFAGVLVVSVATLAQKPEIYLGPISDDPLPPPGKAPPSHLAKCLKNPADTPSCAAAGSVEGGFESALVGQLQSSAYVACSAPAGVCLELATLDLSGTNVTSEPSSDRLAAVAITIAFDFDSVSIRVSEERKLTELAAALVHPDNQGARFAIIGHTDAKGTAAYNCRLSRRRADEVAARLAALHVPTARLLTIGVGLNVPNNRANGLSPENRRVAFAPIADEHDPMLRKLAVLCQG
jgi:outer membrane protein OmpA-like peptidoglycan-associated protein